MINTDKMNRINKNSDKYIRDNDGDDMTKIEDIIYLDDSLQVIYIIF